MRELTGHKGDSLNDRLTVRAWDETDRDGPCCRYTIEYDATDGTGEIRTYHITFQKGSVLEEPVIGISDEALLAIIEDRLCCGGLRFSLQGALTCLKWWIRKQAARDESKSKRTD